ncbi:MAG: SDR family NAD(P)-dependent oxidoreductase [Tannerella sp.]|jgi:short-subunit dehydrogenase|nr:SDR family NAD(P)-dependent oxidoreductase [Tannerella sp.]
MKRAIIIGATSGIGREVAKKLLAEGWQIGVAGRREQELTTLQALSPERVSIQTLDVTREDAPEQLRRLIAQTGGMDLFFLSSGVGWVNPELQPEIELRTVETNASGFVRMVTAAFLYFREHQGGHLAVISSVAGTRGIGSAPAYSATKRFQNIYIEGLAQLAHNRKLNIHFTDIRPGFVDTAILDGNGTMRYPMLMKPERVAAQIVRALNRRRRIAVIDWRYACLVFVWRLIPLWLWERIRLKNQ